MWGTIQGHRGHTDATQEQTHTQTCAHTHTRKNTLQNTYSNGAVDRKFDLNH